MMALKVVFAPANASLPFSPSLSLFGSGLTYLLNRLASVFRSHVCECVYVCVLVCILTAVALHCVKPSITMINKLAGLVQESKVKQSVLGHHVNCVILFPTIIIIVIRRKRKKNEKKKRMNQHYSSYIF